jgi:hypothetical protein
VTTILGLIGVVLFIVAVLALSAAVTYAVVRLLPPPDEKKAREAKADAGG